MRVLFPGLSLLLATPALACERDSGAVQLPGESKENFEYRMGDILSATSAYYTVSRQTDALENASLAYIAVVKSSKRASESASGMYETVVEPRKALKGRLPTKERLLKNPNTGGLCFDAGDGSGANGRPGDIVMVFEGLSKKDDRPNGIDSFLAVELRTIELLDALAAYLGHEVEQ